MSGLHLPKLGNSKLHLQFCSEFSLNMHAVCNSCICLYHSYNFFSLLDLGTMGIQLLFVNICIFVLGFLNLGGFWWLFCCLGGFVLFCLFVLNDLKF